MSEYRDKRILNDGMLKQFLAPRYFLLCFALRFAFSGRIRMLSENNIVAIVLIVRSTDCRKLVCLVGFWFTM